MGGQLCGFTSNGQTRCIGGTCQVTFCAANHADCNGMPNDGCEEDLNVSQDHCGGCFRSCGADTGRHYLAGSCFQGVCERPCEMGWGDCNNNPVDGCERQIDGFDMQHCGGCNQPCLARQNAQGAFCSGGVCQDMCLPGFQDCNMNPGDGCETDITRDLTHCGGCAGMGGTTCDFGAGGEPPVCELGVCRLLCPAGSGSCDGDPMTGCETDTRSDRDHCGACGNFCPDGPSGFGACVNSACTLMCDPGTADCDATPGCETFTGADIANCGGCGVTCGAGGSCALGFCDRGLALSVSLLGPHEPLPHQPDARRAARALRPGVDGVVLAWRGRRATFLPQVWAQLPDADDFVAALLHKAGLGEGFWAEDLTLARYEVRCFDGVVGRGAMA